MKSLNRPSSPRRSASPAAEAESLVGAFTARLEALNGERAALAAEIRQLLRAAEDMLAAMGHEQSAEGRRRGGRPRGFRISEATRAKLKAAWARRKAAK